MGLFSTKYDSLRIEADFARQMAEADRRLRDQVAHKQDHIDMQVRGEDPGNCRKCGQSIAAHADPNRSLPAVTIVDDRIREKNAELELKINPPDFKERMKNEPLYVRLQRMKARNAGMDPSLADRQPDVLEKAATKGIGLLAAGGIYAGRKAFEAAKGGAQRVTGGTLKQEAGKAVDEQVQRVRTAEENLEIQARQNLRVGGALGLGGLSPAQAAAATEKLRRERAAAGLAGQIKYAQPAVIQPPKQDYVNRPQTEAEKGSKELVRKLF